MLVESPFNSEISFCFGSTLAGFDNWLKSLAPLVLANQGKRLSFQPIRNKTIASGGVADARFPALNGGYEFPRLVPVAFFPALRTRYSSSDCSIAFAVIG